MQIGKYEIKYVESSRFPLDGGAMFGIIPKPLWEKNNPADEKNRIEMAARHLLLISDDRKIVVDTGMGDKWDEKAKKIYKITDTGKTLKESLEEEGIGADEITDVFLTHLHFDHAGGATELDSGKAVPAFPNAKYHVQAKHFEWALNPTDKDGGSFIKDNFVPLKEEGVLRLLSEQEMYLDDGIEIIALQGHTVSQQIIKIFDSSKILLHCGDFIPTASHIPLPYIMGYDIHPLKTLEEKQIFLPRAAEENWILFFGHDPFNAFATVKQSKKGFIPDEFFGEQK